MFPQQRRQRGCHAPRKSDQSAALVVAAMACGGLFLGSAEAFLSPAAGRLPFAATATSRATVAAVGAGPVGARGSCTAVAARRGGEVYMSAVRRLGSGDGDGEGEEVEIPSVWSNTSHSHV